MRRFFQEKPGAVEFLLPAMVFTLAVSLFPLFSSGMTWILGDRFGQGAGVLGLIALVIFGLSFLAKPLRGLLCSYKAIIFSAGGVAILSLLAQIGFAEPLINFICSALGLSFFAVFLAVYLDSARVRGASSVGHFGAGVVFGLLLNTALSAGFGTYDLVNQPSVFPLLISAVIAAFILFLLSVHMPLAEGPAASNNGLGWLVIGPFLFLELVVFGNIARLSALSGFSSPVASLFVLGALSLGLVGILWVFSLNQRHIRLLSMIASLFLILSLTGISGGVAAISLAQHFLGQLALILLFGVILRYIGGRMAEGQPESLNLPNGLGMILFVILLLGYYAVYQVAVPYDNTVLELVAGLMVVVLGLYSGRECLPLLDFKGERFILPAMSILLLTLPLLGLLTYKTPPAAPQFSGTLRIMTYNLHNGFNTQGKLDLEALARVIEDSGADVVALQEISRGWVISGRVDMLEWLAQRLNMHFAFGATAGEYWGNAILSKYPILDTHNVSLESEGLPIKRGYLNAVLDLGVRYLYLAATHLHHVPEEGEVRVIQAEELADFWHHAPSTVIMGDFNAEPDSTEIAILRQAGFSDSLEGHTSVLTYHAADLYQRIDYIWASPDIEYLDSYTVFSLASDHLAIIADIRLS
ncbi:MAG: endonuclease/exonuclease/phosphatase family protein [Dehalococcoides mccartyi]|uniref:endonuclease/exonuclease/phosphatase family protein n=1 Tax=Dehalococcoides mccartyi TaxID=61435 RepID=UPI0025C91D9E|nr:endonuclease/exonuclease/phosphatase family protein [Dehalococcoides mccartyi]MDN4186231.1 endonuclease/exonuclease/phosphatase family protein [Dehalococcoides mccartyi]